MPAFIRLISAVGSAVLLSAPFLSGHLLAQPTNYPTFNSSTKITNIQLSGSPAFATDPNNGALAVAFGTYTTPARLSFGESTNGVNFGVYNSGVAMYSSPSLASYVDLQGHRFLYAAFAGPSGDVQIWNVTNGQFSLVTDFVPQYGTVISNRQPALYQFGNALYLAYVGTAYDNGNGSYDGTWVQAAYFDGSAFQELGSFGQNPVGNYAYSPLDGPSLAVYNSQLYLSFLDSATGNPQMFAANQVYSPYSLSFYQATGAAGMGGHYKNTPAMASFQGSLFPMFTSAYSSDNVWVVGTNDGTNYSNPMMYGQTETNSPALTVANGNVLYQGGRTNYPSSGAYLWIQSATANTTAVPATTGGGGGGSPCAVSTGPGTRTLSQPVSGCKR